MQNPQKATAYYRLPAKFGVGSIGRKSDRFFGSKLCCINHLSDTFQQNFQQISSNLPAPFLHNSKGRKPCFQQISSNLPATVFHPLVYPLLLEGVFQRRFGRLRPLQQDAPSRRGNLRHQPPGKATPLPSPHGAISPMIDCDHPRERLEATGQRYTHRCGVCGGAIVAIHADREERSPWSARPGPFLGSWWTR